MTESNYEAIMSSTLPNQLADEHWEFIQRWLEMVYKDAFIHGYKHGIEDSKEK
uniref:Uncharacterized protein n=1 Tax=viral metagenome TaxID=1070528 RepID=A0A6M3KKW9_9ZZZZ